MRVALRVPVKPTEDERKVRDAVARLFPGADLVLGEGVLEGTVPDLRPLRQRIWELRIIDTFRGQFLHGAPSPQAKATTFRLSKQAASAGKVSFPPTPHALGDIEVQVTVEPGDPWGDVEGAALWLCPETKDGEIVGPVLP